MKVTKIYRAILSEDELHMDFVEDPTGNLLIAWDTKTGSVTLNLVPGRK